MKKNISSLCVLLALCLVLTGCGGNDPENPVTPPEPETLEGEWLGELTVPAGSLLGNTVQLQAVYAPSFLTLQFRIRAQSLLKEMSSPLHLP